MRIQYQMSRSAESKIDPVVANLTPSQKRQILQLYGGGDPHSRETWEDIPNLTLDQIKLVMAEQNSPSHAAHDYGTPQSGTMYHPYPQTHGQQPFMGPSSAGNGYHQRKYQEPPRPHPATYSPQTPYQVSSCPPSSTMYPDSQASGQHTTDYSSSFFSLGGGADNIATDNDYSVMVIGVTGSGKSTACNFFLNKKVFNTKGGAVSVTIKSDAHSGIVLGKKIMFIDTPGFSDAYESEEQRMADLGRALYFAQAGVHAIAICFNGTARFDLATEGVVNALDQLGTFWPHAFVLYSHADDMGSTESEQKQQIHQWLNNPRCPDRLKWLLEKVQYRFMTVESRMRGGDHAYHEQKCKELIDFVEHVYASNNRQLYTNKLFKWAKQKYDQARREKRRQEEELKKCQESLLDQQQLLKSFEEQSIMLKKSHQQAIDSLQQEIRSLRQQQQQSQCQQEKEELYYRLLQKQTGEQEENRKLNSIIQEQKETMEQIRQALSEHQREQGRLQSLQNQSVMEQYMKDMKEDMRAIKAENKELRDRIMERDKPVGQHQCQTPTQDDDDNEVVDLLVEGAVKGAVAIAKKCSVM